MWCNEKCIFASLTNSENTVFITQAPWINRDRINFVGRHVASIRLESARRQVHLARRVFYASGRALTDIPHSAGDARHRRNSYTRPYANSGSTERYGNGDRFSAVVSGYATVVSVARQQTFRGTRHHYHYPLLSFARPEAARQAALVYRSLCPDRCLYYSAYYGLVTFT